MSLTFWVALLLLILFSVSLRVTPTCCAAPPGVLAQDVTVWQHLHHLPAIGIILAESMRHLSTGYWWLGGMPGLLLLLSVKAFDWLGENLRALLDPRTSQG
ncbi:peptide ABC transporter permease (plasmid) [Leptolyngbya sp. BL0902]|nr:peptide ABC transporter permease [Leptolyngbya sp. BL0902]